MNISVVGKQMRVTGLLDWNIRLRALKLERFYDRIVKCQVTIAKEAVEYRVDVVIHVPGRTLRSAHQHESGFAAIGRAMNKMERQLKRLNDKQVRVRSFRVKEKMQEMVSDVEIKGVT